MKTRTLYTIRADGRSYGKRLRNAAHTRRAIRTLFLKGVLAVRCPTQINAEEFDAFGRRIPPAAPIIDCRTGRVVRAAAL